VNQQKERTLSLPHFLCIGAQKAATSWLYAILKQHPNVWMPPIKEVHFFDRLAKQRLDLRRYRGIAEKRRRLAVEQGLDAELIDYFGRVSSYDEASLDWYREVFSWPVAPDVKIGDITPAYLDIPEQTVRYAREQLGDIKIIVIVRHPLDRELSQLRMAATRAARGYRKVKTEKQWMRIFNSMVGDSRRGSYSTGIPLWQDAFSEKNFLALPFGDVRETPQLVMKRVEDFLEIPALDTYNDLSTPYHKTKKAEIPQTIIDLAAERVAAEDTFLRRHFGEEFYARTK